MYLLFILRRKNCDREGTDFTPAAWSSSRIIITPPMRMCNALRKAIKKNKKNSCYEVWRDIITASGSQLQRRSARPRGGHLTFRLAIETAANFDIQTIKRWSRDDVST